VKVSLLSANDRAPSFCPVPVSVCVVAFTRFNSIEVDVVLIDCLEFKTVTTRCQAVALEYMAVEGDGSLLACGNRVDYELLTCEYISSDEDVRIVSLVCERIGLDCAVLVELDSGSLEETAVVRLLTDAVYNCSAVSMLSHIVIKLRIELALGVSYAEAFPEVDSGDLAALGCDIGLSPSGVNLDSFFLAELSVLRTHRHIVISLEAVEMNLIGTASYDGTGNVGSDVAAADDNDFAGHLNILARSDSPDEIDACANAFGILARDSHLAGTLKSRADIESVVSLSLEFLNRDVPADVNSHAKLYTELTKNVDFSINDILLKSERRDSVGQHAAWLGVSVEYGDIGVTLGREIVRA